MMKENAQHYHMNLGKSCSESMLMAANEEYDLKLTEEEILLFAGFRHGMGCRSTCGCLTGAIGVLSRMYAGREDLKAICGNYVAFFTEKLNCGTTECAVLEATYRKDTPHCGVTVGMGADALKEYIASL